MQLGSRYNQHSFAQTPSIGLPRSVFDRSFEVKDTYDFDYIYPFYLDEVLPGDTFNVNVNIFARLATQKVPIMDRLYASYEFFFVPTRLVWSNFKKMMGEQEDPGDSTDFTTPKLNWGLSTTITNGSLADKLGLPTDVGLGSNTNLGITSLPFRCYQLCYRDWYRDQNLINSNLVPTDDGPDSISDVNVLRKRAKAHDYFTSALPWPQKSDPVNILIERTDLAGTWTAYNTGTNTPTPGGAGTNMVAGGSGLIGVSGIANVSLDPNGGLKINPEDIRQGMAMQALFERDARGGTRFPEVILSHFNTVLPDFTVQRPEYLGGGHFDINIHPVAKNSSTDATSPQGNLAAFATHMVSGRALGFQKSFVEWGYVLGLVSFRAAVSYQSGFHRMWTRSTRWDYYWPEFAELGEQAIYEKEIYSASGTPNAIFGYQERFAEYKFKQSEIRGAFRSQYATSLDVWHMAEEFSSTPTLNQTFIESNTPIERSIVVTEGEPQIIFNAFIDQKCVRPMPIHSIPATLGRF